MSGRTLILSDTHFGRPRLAARSADALRPLWQGFDTLVINGDLAEVHHPKYWAVAARQTMRLLELCEQDGVEAILLSGNHDPYITDRRHLELCGGAVFVTHGDVLHPAVAPWSPRAGRMMEAHDRALAALPPEERGSLEARLRVSQYASHVEWDQMQAQAAKSSLLGMLLRPWSIAQVLWYWRQVPKLAADFLRAHVPAARFAIIGHTHRPGIWRVCPRGGDCGGERTIINTGSYGFPGTPRAVAVDEAASTLSVLAIERAGEQYRFAPQPLARFEEVQAAGREEPAGAAA